MAEPTRTCTGCGEKGDKSALWRVVAGDGRPVVDSTRARPGRGAYVHGRAACIERAVKRRAFARALGTPGSAEPALAEELIVRVGVAIQSGKRQ
ncbi:MAG TPA: YlxR family protein [Kofleriaceae bacterium]|nr:YlxR family protein [Kofleriaceae bacterium]